MEILNNLDTFGDIEGKDACIEPSARFTWTINHYGISTMFVFTSLRPTSFFHLRKICGRRPVAPILAHLAPMDLNIELEWRWYWGNPSLSGWVPEERPRMEKSRGCDFLPLASKKAMSWIQSFLVRIEHLHDLYTVLGSHPLFSIRVSENGTRNNSFYGGLQGKMMINQWILDDFRVTYSQANPNGYPLVN